MKQVKIDLKQLFTRSVEVDIRQQIYPGVRGSKLVRFFVVLIVLFILGYQIGQDASRRDSRSANHAVVGK